MRLCVFRIGARSLPRACRDDIFFYLERDGIFFYLERDNIFVYLERDDKYIIFTYKNKF